MSNIKCPKCGNLNEPDSVFCEECGQRLNKVESFSTDFTSVLPGAAAPAGGKKCPKCGATFPNDNIFCENCGIRLVSISDAAGVSAPSPAPAPAPSPASAVSVPPPAAPAPAPSPAAAVSPAAAPAFVPPPIPAGGAPEPAKGLKINMGHSSSGGSAGQNENFKPLNNFDE